MRTEADFICKQPTCGCFLAFLMVTGLVDNAPANPTGMSVQSGAASAVTSGPKLTVTTSKTAVLNWQSFNIGAGETTIFNQPSSSSVVLNQIGGASASQIYGSLQANGIVVLVNSSGFYLGPNSFISAAGFVLSTAQAAPPSNPGGAWEFNGPAPAASIINYGQINVAKGGSAYLIAENVQNNGSINAPEGGIGMVGGQNVLLSDRPDGRGLSVQVKMPEGTVDNEGFLRANGGNISLEAQAVNQSGVIQANSVKNENGVIELVAADDLTLGANSQISANGDASPAGSPGGAITLQSGNTFSDSPGSQVSAAGGSRGGSGGSIEISAPDMDSLNSSVTAVAQAGSTSGTLSLDPNYIILDTSGTGSAGSGTVLSTATPSTLDLNVNSAFSGFSQILLEAKDDITLADGTDWNLSASTGQSAGTLTLEAGRNIIFGNTTGIYDYNNWSVNLYAGVGTFSSTQPAVTPGAGSIYFNAYNPNDPNNNPTDPSGFIETSSGSINLVAGQDVIVGSGQTGVVLIDGSTVNEGSVTTVGGGNISVHALTGDIDTGGTAQGYTFQSGATSLAQAYNLVDGLGGISTAAGGNVSLTAGGDILSTFAISGQYYYDGSREPSNPNNAYYTGGTGAYGVGLSGNVTLVAGGDIIGDYTVADGTGAIYAGVKMDATGNPVTDASGNYVLKTDGTGNAGNGTENLALNLVNGGWSVTAANDIILQEVRNPNGVFDTLAGSKIVNLFDYGSGDYVDLDAGNGVQLGSSTFTLPRPTITKVPVIYPPILNVTAGMGGVQLAGSTAFNSLTLFPSAQGGLTISTTDGGKLFSSTTSGGAPDLFDLIVSDSAATQYKTSASFGLTDHATSPVHAGHETPIILNISGDMDDIYLGVSEAATINVGGDMKNCSFQGMNLSPGDVTSINVAGNIAFRSAFTTADLTGVGDPDMADLAHAFGNSIGSTSISVAQLLSSLYYDSSQHQLTYQSIPNVTISQIINLLENLQVQVYVNGVPKWQDSPNDTIPQTTHISILTPAEALALQNAYAAAGGGPPVTGGNITTFGYILGGGGKFNLTADNLDLGGSAGIESEGASLYQVNGTYPLAKYSPLAADISVNLAGTLTMVSSSITSDEGGDIFVNADGEIDVGTTAFSILASGARGIYTTADSDVYVSATDDINIDGSRIAGYNGGDVTVISREGSIDAGAGGGGAAIVADFTVNPVTHAVSSSQTTIPGSGILTTAYNPTPGNILVEAPNGQVTATAGGISQLALLHPYPAGTTINNITVDSATLDGIFDATLNGDYGTAAGLQHDYNGVAGNVYLDVFAGYALEKLDGSGDPVLDSYGNPVVNAGNLLDGTQVKFTDNQDISAKGSGIVGAGNVNLNASGSISGNIFGLNNVNINAVQNVDVLAVGLGTVSVGSQAGTISGTIIGVGGVSASGASIEANLESNGSISGATSGQTGLSAGTAANAGSAAASASTANQTAASNSDTSTDDDLKKKKAKTIGLAQKVSRVTVLLPQKTGT